MQHISHIEERARMPLEPGVTRFDERINPTEIQKMDQSTLKHAEIVYLRQQQ